MIYRILVLLGCCFVKGTEETLLDFEILHNGFYNQVSVLDSCICVCRGQHILHNLLNELLPSLIEVNEQQQ